MFLSILLLFPTINFDLFMIERLNRIICESASSTRIIRLMSIDNSPVLQTLRNHLNERCFAAPIEMITFINDKPLSLSYFGTSTIVIVGNSSGNSFHHNFEKPQENKFIIILNSIVVENQKHLQWLRDVFEWYWNQGVLNICIAFSNGTALRLFTFSPFNRNAESHWIELSEIDEEGTSLWFDRVSDVRGYQLNVTMYPDDIRAYEKTNWDRVSAAARYGGVDGNVAALMEQRYNN